MRIDIYTDFEQELEEIWSVFEENALMTFFQSYAWLSHWQRTIGDPLMLVTPQVVHIYNDKNTLAILPMGIRKKFGIRILEWLGGPNTDYMGPLVHPEFNYNIELWQKIKSLLLNYDVIHFQKQPEWVVRFIKGIGFSSEFKRSLRAYKTELPTDWDSYFNNLKKKLRSDSKRQWRRLSEKDSVNFITAINPSEKLEIIKTMVTQKSRRYQETGVWDMLAVEEYRNFYESLLYLSSKKLNIHCSSLNVGNTKVATHVGYFDESTFYYLMPAHEGGEWLKYSPGRLLLIELMRWSITNGLKSFDFTIGGEVYKKDWINHKSDLWEYKINQSLAGFLFIKLLELRENFKKSNLLIKGLKFFRKVKKKKFNGLNP